MEIKKICILGAGMMGHQTAQLAAMSGHEVSIVDINDAVIQHGLDTIKGNLQKYYVDKGKIPQAEADAIFGRLKGTTDLKEALKGAQVMIESVTEILELKQRLFKEMDEICSPEVVLASNTSGMMITAIATLTKHPERVIGMHFFNPAYYMKLVEIIRGAKTSDSAYQVIADLCAKFGKETITVNDAPGFAIGRLFDVLVNEGAKLVYEGVCTAEDVDKGCRLGLGHAMGPLRTVDMANAMGVVVHALGYLREQLGDEYNACPLIKKKFLAGEHGEWAGKGFHDYGQK